MTTATDVPTTEERVRPRGSGWRVAIASFYCLVFGPSAVLVTGFGAFAHPLSQAFGWSRAAIAFAVTLLALMIMVLSPLQGILIDRIGGRRLILWSIPAFAAGLVGMSRLGGNIVFFYAAFVIVPMLAVGVWPASYMKLTGSWFSRHLGLALGTANAGIGLGAIVITPIASWVIEHHGWRAAYLTLAGLALTTLPVAAFFVRGAEHDEAPPLADMDVVLTVPVRDREFRLIVAGYFLIGITGTGLLTNLVPMMTRAGLAPHDAVVGMSLFGMTSLLGRFISGFLLDRLPARAVINVFILISTAGLVAFALGVTGPAIFAAAIAFGLLSGGEFDVLGYCVRRYFGMAVFGRVYGIAFAAFQLGAALGAAGLSLSLAKTDSYHAGLWCLAIAQVAALAVFARLGPYRHA